MSTIQQELLRLRKSVGKLEVSLHGLEASMAGEQRDMFSIPVMNGGKFSVDNNLIAQRLDKVIRKVEEVLKD